MRINKFYSKGNATVIIFIVIGVLFIGYYYMARISIMVESVSSSFLYPVLRIQHAFIEPLGRWFATKKTVASLEDELCKIKQERDLYCAQLVETRSLFWYQQETQQLHDFNARYATGKGLIAQILVRHISRDAHFMLVDAGAWQGVKKEMVALYNNCLVGKVVEVYPWYCKVILVTDADCKVAAYCAQTKASGIHQGNTNTMSCLHYVSHLEHVVVDDIILSSGQGLIFPAGFALGTVYSACPGQLCYDIEVKPIVDFYSLQYCILIGKEEIRHP